MIVVVVRAFVAFVGVIEVRAVEMVVETVLAFRCGFVVFGHEKRVLENPDV